MKTKAASHANIFGNTTVLRYSQFHAPRSIYEKWTARHFKLYLFLMESMSAADSLFVVLTAAQIAEGCGIDPSDLNPVRNELQRSKVIDFHKAPGFRGGWRYEATNPVTGHLVKSLDYIDREGLTRAQIERYARVRLSVSSLNVVGNSSILATCPLCGSVGSFTVQLPDAGKRGHGDWSCVGECKDKAIAGYVPGTRWANTGKLVTLEQRILERKRGPQMGHRAARFSVEAITQNTLIDFDPDAGYIPSDEGVMQARLDDIRAEHEYNYNPTGVEP